MVVSGIGPSACCPNLLRCPRSGITGQPSRPGVAAPNLRGGMKVYEDYAQSPDGRNITITLTLEDDGRFVYDEWWTDYTNATIGGQAQGHWRWRGGNLVFRTESAEGSLGDWIAGQDRIVVEQGDRLDFGSGSTLRLRPTPEPSPC